MRPADNTKIARTAVVRTTDYLWLYDTSAGELVGVPAQDVWDELFPTEFTLTTPTSLARATHNRGLIYNTGAIVAIQHTLWASPTLDDTITFERVPRPPASGYFYPEVRIAPQAGHSIHGGALGAAVSMLTPGRVTLRWNGTLWCLKASCCELDWEP